MIITFEGEFTSFNEFGNAHVNPQTTRADGFEKYEWDSHLLSNIKNIAVQSIGYDACDWRPFTTVTTKTFTAQYLS